MSLRRLFLLAVLAVFFLPSFVIADPEPLYYAEWEVVYDGPAGEGDLPYRMSHDAAGNLYIIGYSVGIDTQKDLIVLKYSPTGELVYEYRYDGENHADDKGYQFHVYDNGEVYLIGSDNLRYLFAYLNSAGELQWSEVDNEYNYFIFGLEIGIVEDDADYLFTAYSIFEEDLLVNCFDPSGVTQWQDVYPTDYAYQFVYDMKHDGQGNVYVAGTVFTPDPFRYTNYTVIKYDRTEGRRWNYLAEVGSSHGCLWSDEAHFIAFDEQGNVYVTGQLEFHDPDYTRDYSPFTVKLDSDGNVQWTALYEGESENDYGDYLWLDQDGNVYVIVNIAETQRRASLLKYDSTGVFQWEHEITVPAYAKIGIINMQPVEGDGVYLTGYGNNGGNSTGVMLKYSFSGDINGYYLIPESEEIHTFAYDCYPANDGAVYLMSHTRQLDVLNTNDIVLQKISPCYGCLIDDECFDDGATVPENGCLVCAVDQSRTQWTNNDGATCDDGLFCNGVDECNAGACEVHAGDPCEENETCDEVNDECVGGDDDTVDDDTTDDDTTDDDTVDDDTTDDDTTDDDTTDDDTTDDDTDDDDASDDDDDDDSTASDDDDDDDNDDNDACGC